MIRAHEDNDELQSGDEDACLEWNHQKVEFHGNPQVPIPEINDIYQVTDGNH